MDYTEQTIPIQEIDINEYKKGREKEAIRKNAVYMFIYLALSGLSLISIIIVAEGKGRSLAICFYGGTFLLGLLAFIYISVSRLKKVRNSGVQHVYKGEAIIKEGKLYKIQYIDIDGKCREMQSPLLEKMDLRADTKIMITIEDDKIAKIDLPTGQL